ncbi:hypothetical protein ACFWD7_58220 [Streptomyces mirabilis]
MLLVDDTEKLLEGEWDKLALPVEGEVDINVTFEGPGRPFADGAPYC